MGLPSFSPFWFGLAGLLGLALLLIPFVAWTRKPPLGKLAAPPDDLSRCPRDELVAAANAIASAIDIGAPAYNEGDHEGCYCVYEQTALSLIRRLECGTIKATLQFGLDEAKGKSSVTDKAWSMRHAFDAVLSAVDGHLRQSAPASSAEALARKVPQHPLSLLDECSDESLDETVSALNDAISVGAPRYNEGDHERCFRVYRSAARTLQQRVSDCKGIRQALDDGLAEAKSQKSFTDKAWALRDAFDGLLLVIEKKLSH